ncbi:type I restriction endonuclease subunit R [Nocardioides aurantiacus]|uniref:Type I restriction enzyme R subunit n=1 Tax=Nocardioides aurantiacus TaxID=86796 RepID=A0A3N2CRF6_9ACTN|nr:type I restriction endonuclease [Nocardioides aurantiacus]ROR89996.1 type I restriction enzyme R subunit [Nocardioides aurantiacus]
MAQEHESVFEQELCEYLATHGWLYSKNGEGYDKVRALFPEDVFGWLEDTQPEELAKVVKPGASSADTRKSKDLFLDRLVKALDAPLESGGGTLNVLRKGFKKTPAKFRMCEFKPATSLNKATLERYGKVRLRVMRQVHYSKQRPAESIDLVFFVNGLPVGTIELKTDTMQTVEDAKKQYRDDRPVKGEPLLQFGSRALVHFAMSNDEVYMTTKLAGQETHFLPFNMGRDGGAGNPVVPGTSSTSYMWERVLDRDAWLNIIGKFLHVEIKDDIDPITGAKSKKTTLLFPRFHQWELVTNLLDTVQAEGPGHHYLGAHSAGSGKTNSISWTAHGLSTLHDENNEKVFDSVIVVTDRTVLDDQLQAAIKQIEGTAGTVAKINIDEARKSGQTSKSGLLAQQLVNGKLIIIVTMQTFPFAMAEIAANKGLAHKKFAIIADEAHSSQTGRTSQQLRKVLTDEEEAELKDGGEIDTEALLAAEMEDRADSPNLSFFAFTATPKPKTMELFGRRDPNGIPRAFHEYTMRQAIEEGFILDVLQNYTTYDTAFRIAEKAKATAATGKTKLSEVKVVDEVEATKGLMKWVSLHPTNVAQKVQIIVEHYRTNVRHLIDGHAKAMVVTSSREAAVRYKEAIDAYIKKRGYTDIATLIAFSGSIEVDGVTFPGVEPPYTEGNLNTQLKGRSLPKAFATDEFQIMLVANKFQTGFDQPLLCAMYVDKRLSGVTTVQTLSRLNRTYAAGGKDTTYVLDFVNDPDEILADFKVYYETATLEGETDPDLVHDLQAKLDNAGIYTTAEVDAFAEAYVGGKGNSAIQAPLKAAKDRFNDRYNVAVAADDKATVDDLDVFRKDVGSFIRLYDFLSQIVNYQDTDLEKRSLYLRFLARQITAKNRNQEVDFSTVELTHIKQTRTADRSLDLGTGEAKGLKPITATGSGQSRDPNMVRLEAILAKVNDLFAGEDFTVAEQRSWVEGVVTVLMDDDTIQTQATNNSKKQFMESPDLNDAVVEAVLGNQTSHNKMADIFFTEDKIKVALVHLLGELVHENIKAEEQPA